MRYKTHSKRREITLGRNAIGASDHITLADARGEAPQIQAAAKKGIDPLAEREISMQTMENGQGQVNYATNAT